MRVLFDGLVFTSYAQMKLTTGIVEPPIPDVAFIGQVNGLCGATVAGALFLITGTHTGWVPVRVSLRCSTDVGQFLKGLFLCLLVQRIPMSSKPMPWPWLIPPAAH